MMKNRIIPRIISFHSNTIRSNKLINKITSFTKTVYLYRYFHDSNRYAYQNELNYEIKLQTFVFLKIYNILYVLLNCIITK